ncbi:hypothetical protein JRO89_XS06G0103600 [Xanthoceras sorbifolium]|uniref:Gnk2-homologous domain-containing protein n=1 Tax=Xanthoceras sorbifolium TaxID=99658 RepID=A0ABQ8HXK9_9ROSI|nr:hypothetical protein JRO89_XS06G0103600 [Xanthoceras sorbifolium]
MEVAPRYRMINLENVTSLDQFNQVLRSLLDGLRSKAASGGSLLKFATGNTSAPDFKTLYGLVQCTPDLSELQCNDCLDTIAGRIPDCCNGKEGATIEAPSCKLRYEINRFYHPSADELTPPSNDPATTKGKDGNNTRNIIIIIVSAVVGFVILIIFISIFLRTRKFKEKFEGNFSDNGPYDSNRNLILSSLAPYVHINNGGFYNTSIGQDPNQVYALALCRGDSPSNESCNNCVKATSQSIMTQCPYQKEAFTWGDKEPPCLVRYADHSVSGILDLPPVLVEYVGNLTDLVKSNLTEFHQTWVSLMDGLVKEVSMGSSSLKFTTKKAKFNTFQKIYALMQCTPDLSLGDCDVCLRQSVAESQACCLRTIGGNVQRANCYFGWALSPFYSPHTDASPSVSTTRPQINNTVDNYNGMSTFQKYYSLVQS